MNPDKIGSKAAAHYTLRLDSGASDTIHLRLTNDNSEQSLPHEAFNAIFLQRIQEADEFYHASHLPIFLKTRGAFSCRHLPTFSEQAVLPLRRQSIAERRPHVV